MATIRQVIQYVDDVKPNAFSNSTKVEWINEAEGLVQTEVLLRAIEEVETYTWEEDADTELLVRPPHDKLYRAYLTAMIDYANGEYGRYSNTVQMFNAHLGEFQRWFATVYRPADTHGEVYADAGTLIDTEWRGYYITAYGIAVKHGYQGTEAQWLEEIYGGATAAAASAEAAAASAEAAAASEEAAEESAEAAAASELAAKDYAEHIADPVSGIVTDWLDDNIAQETGYVIDKALVTEDAAADAKATGIRLDRITALHGLVDYGYVDGDLTPTSTTNANAVAVSRRNTEVTLSLASAISNAARVKISGALDRRGNTSGVSQWTTGLALVNGRKYRVTMARLSGSVSGSGYPQMYVYKAGSSVYVDGDVTAASASLFIREFTAPAEEVNLAVYIPSGTTLTNAKYQVLLEDCTCSDAGDIGRTWEKQTLIDGMPFYSISAPFSTSRPYYTKSGNNWVEGPEKPSTAPIPCPQYLMVYPKYTGTGKNLYLYVGSKEYGRFVIDKTVELVVTTPNNHINFISKDWLFRTLETDGTKYMVILGSGITGDRYDNDFMIIGADEWPESPVLPNAWTYYSGGTNNSITWESTDKQGYFLPEESWVFVKGMSYALLNYGNGTASGTPWATAVENVSAFYLPKDSVAPLLTVNASDEVKENNVCIVPKILDMCISGNARKARNLADRVLKNFRWTGMADTANITDRSPITVGKEYHTIPYSSRWNGQHYVGYETTPETAANSANDEYSVFYDNTEGRSELSEDGQPGYGQVCSVWASLAAGSPYPQSTNGIFADQNFEVMMLDNPRSGDILTRKDDTTSHEVVVADVFQNGYTLYEQRSPGLIETVHTTGETWARGTASGLVNRQYLYNYDYRIASRDRSGWDTNYLQDRHFDYTIANGSIRPWRGNKSVCSNFNKLSPTPSGATCTGIHITVHDGAATAHIKKPGGTVVDRTVTGQTVFTINDICDEPGTYELWSDVSDTREYFRYFEHAPVYLRLDDDWTAVFEYEDGTEATDIDYAYVSTWGAETPYPEVGRRPVQVMAKGKKYPGIRFKIARNALARDTTEVNDEEDSWGRYPVECRVGYSKWVQPRAGEDGYANGAKARHNGKNWVSTASGNVSEPGVANWTEVTGND